MSRHAHKDSEIRPNPDLPLFAEQSFTQFEQAHSALLGTGESTETKDSSPQSRESAKPKDRILPRQSPTEQARARRDDPQTSHDAAKSVKLANLSRTRDGILDVLKVSGPQTDEQIWDTYSRWYSLGRTVPKASPSGVRSRRAELVAMGFVEACGTGKTVAKRDCTIWRLTPMGEQK